MHRRFTVLVFELQTLSLATSENLWDVVTSPKGQPATDTVTAVFFIHFPLQSVYLYKTPSSLLSGVPGISCLCFSCRWSGGFSPSSGVCLPYILHTRLLWECKPPNSVAMKYLCSFKISHTQLFQWFLQISMNVDWNLIPADTGVWTRMAATSAIALTGTCSCQTAPAEVSGKCYITLSERDRITVSLHCNS